MRLKVWNDINWKEEKEKKSISRFVFTITREIIIYLSKKQKSIALFNIKLKYIILFHIWFFREIDYNFNN